MASLPCSSPQLAETEEGQGRDRVEKTEEVRRDRDRSRDREAQRERKRDKTDAKGVNE